MANKISLEEEVKIMEKHFGGLVSLVKDLKAKVETFDKILGINEKQEIQDILEKQRVITELLLSNSESNVDTRTRASANIKLCVDISIQTPFAKFTLKTRNVAQKVVEKDILKYASGITEKLAVEDRTVTFFMSLLQVMKMWRM